MTLEQQAVSRWEAEKARLKKARKEKDTEQVPSCRCGNPAMSNGQCPRCDEMEWDTKKEET